MHTALKQKLRPKNFRRPPFKSEEGGVGGSEAKEEKRERNDRWFLANSTGMQKTFPSSPLFARQETSKVKTAPKTFLRMYVCFKPVHISTSNHMY